MESVSVEQLKPGEVVAIAVENKNGAVLCPEGFVLTEQAINRLRNAGVETVRVQAVLNNDEAINERLASLERRYAAVDDPALLRIKQVVKEQLESMRL